VWIGTGSIDLFADEDITFARRLIGAGVPTELAVFQGGYHGFDLLAPEAAVSKRFAEGWKSALKRAFSKV
jgi:acetyl esterase/lipase